jgi:RNA polymerase sigma-70 factor, ECF subfamily
MLVRAAQHGDRSAFGELYLRYSGMIHSVAVGALSVDQALDVVQETFLRAMRQLRRLREPKAFGAWLTTIARNVVLDTYRAAAGRVEVEEEPMGRETQHDEAEARAALRVIRTLPRAYREPLMMRLVEGMTGPEIAERTGLTAPSVRVNLHRGMKLLRSRLHAAPRKKTA